MGAPPRIASSVWATAVRVNAKTIDAHDRKTIRLEMVEIALLVQSAALGENFQNRIPD